MVNINSSKISELSRQYSSSPPQKSTLLDNIQNLIGNDDISNKLSKLFLMYLTSLVQEDLAKRSFNTEKKNAVKNLPEKSLNAISNPMRNNQNISNFQNKIKKSVSKSNNILDSIDNNINDNQQQNESNIDYNNNDSFSSSNSDISNENDELIKQFSNDELLNTDQNYSDNNNSNEDINNTQEDDQSSTDKLENKLQNLFSILNSDETSLE